MPVKRHTAAHSTLQLCGGPELQRRRSIILTSPGTRPRRLPSRAAEEQPIADATGAVAVQRRSGTGQHRTVDIVVDRAGPEVGQGVLHVHNSIVGPCAEAWGVWSILSIVCTG
jgi:hypothetical protein